ncbi:hypothetical protein V8E52_009275 [Russula decolorans]
MPGPRTTATGRGWNIDRGTEPRGRSCGVAALFGDLGGNGHVSGPNGAAAALVIIVTATVFYSVLLVKKGAYRIKFQHKNLFPATEEEVASDSPVPAGPAVPEDTEAAPHTRSAPIHLSTDGLPDSLRRLFGSPVGCLGLLRFLEETCVCAKPRNAWEPG